MNINRKQTKNKSFRLFKKRLIFDSFNIFLVYSNFITFNNLPVKLRTFLKRKNISIV